jgi:hypothetical protein
MDLAVAGAHQIQTTAEFMLVPQVAARVVITIMEAREPLIQVVVVAEPVMAQALHAQVAMVVQVTHELLIGVNYGTTLCIS